MQNSVSYGNFEIFTLMPSVHLQFPLKILKEEPLQSGAKYISWQKLWKSVVHLVPYIYGVCTRAFRNYKSISAKKNRHMDKISRHVLTNIERNKECTRSDYSKSHISRRIFSWPANIASSSSRMWCRHTHKYLCTYICHMKDAQCTCRMLQNVRHRFGSSWP